MDRRLIIYSALLFLVIGLIIYIDSKAPRPVNWTPTYSVNDKIPYGLYVLDKESENLFEGSPVIKFIESPYEFLDANYDYDSTAYNLEGTFIAIEETSSLDRESVNELLNFAGEGNTVFLSMKAFPPNLLDSLNIKMADKFYYTDSIACKVNKPGGRPHYFAEGISFTLFDSLDLDSVRVLGHQLIDTVQQPNYIQIPVGEGQVLLHTQPVVFTNFHLLKNDHYKYAEDVFSAFPEGEIYWHTSGFGEGRSDSPLGYIVSQEALKWALYLALITLLIFMFFNAKRKQRIIPEIEPVRNTTIDFAKTIGNLYFQEGNHHTIIEKKIIYFLEKIRREYLIDTYSLDDAFIDKLHLKSGLPKEDIEHAVQLIKKHRHHFQSTESDVIELNKAIEKLRL